MSPFLSTLKAVRSTLTSKRAAKYMVRSAKNDNSKFDQIQYYSGIVGISTQSFGEVICRNENSIVSMYDNNSYAQKRQFLGCGHGDEGSVLSKVYEERRVLGYSPEQLFNVVAAVDLYRGFLPWCQRSEILRRYPDGSFDAELEIGFKFLVESYVSHVELNRPKSIKSCLFDHLINIWEFNPGPVPGSCDLYFLVDFKFQSPLYRQAASMFFEEVVSQLVGSFNERCHLIHGPGMQISLYRQKAEKA